VFIGWTSCFCVPSPLVSRGKAYILNQGIVASIIFLFRGRYSGQGVGTTVAIDVKPAPSSRVLRPLDVERKLKETGWYCSEAMSESARESLVRAAALEAL
jgi:hypothetical protein